MSTGALPITGLEGGAGGWRELDRALVATAALAFLVLFASPTRLYYSPVPYVGSYLTFVPLNFIDLIWAAVALALYARAGMPSARLLLAVAGILILGAAGLGAQGTPDSERIADLVLFNLRLFGGLTVGWLLWRAAVPATLLATLYLVGAGLVALSTFVLAAGGGPAYDFYVEMRRYGGIGLAPNEEAMVLAGAFSMLPLLSRQRPWLALAAPMLIAGIFVTGSRTGVLLALAGSALWVPMVLKAGRGLRGLAMWALMILIIAALTWLALQMFQAMLERDTVVSVSGRLETTSDESSVFRVQIWLGVLDYLRRHPAVLLVGIGGSNAAVEWFLKDVIPLWTLHTHDLFLQMLLAYGVAGLGLCAALVLPLLRRGARFPDPASRALRWFALTVVGGQLIQYGMYEEKFLLWFTITVGFVAAASARVPKSTPA